LKDHVPEQDIRIDSNRIYFSTEEYFWTDHKG